MKLKPLLIFLCLIIAPLAFVEASDELLHDRKLYSQAKRALSSNDSITFDRIKSQLVNYPLFPYLEFHSLNNRLEQRPYLEIDNFLNKYPDSFPAKRLLARWLGMIAKEERWHEFQSYYNSNVNSTKFACLNIWAMIQTGQESATKKITQLWDVGKSQPDECDPLFNYWIESGQLTSDILWSRYLKARNQKNNAGLLSYLKKLMPNSQKKMVSILNEIDKNSEKISDIDSLKLSTPEAKSIVFYGLKKLARKQPRKTHDLFIKYNNIYSFTEKETNTLYFRIALQLARNGESQNIPKYLSYLTVEQKNQIIERLVRSYLKTQNWQSITYWINLLPAELRQEEHWQYWSTRAREMLSPSDQKNIDASYEALAKKRHYYGFLAADKLGIDYSFEHQPVSFDDALRNSVLSNASIIRARELFFVGELHAARQEWKTAIKQFDNAQKQALGRLAFEWGWNRKSIEAMAAAKSWDDLTIRFPLNYESHVNFQASTRGIPQTLIYSIARQESAWQIDARSHAGAMGLMQMMPATAKEAAKKANIRHRKSQLFQPEHNIELGSFWISELVKYYENNRLPAIAAYNAGRHRVNKWLEESNNQLPFDIWIEVIPFNETRNYVKNVLAYSVVYSWRLGKTASLLTANESESLL